MKTDVLNNQMLEDEYKEQLKMPFVITVCSGKGGVGKSFCAANLAYALSKQHLSVLVWDANLHYPNQHILFGVEPPVRLKEVYSGRKKVESAIYRIDDNLFILADQFASGKNHVLKSSEILDVYIDILQSTKNNKTAQLWHSIKIITHTYFIIYFICYLLSSMRVV